MGKGEPYVRFTAYMKADSKSSTHAMWFACVPEHAAEILTLLRDAYPRVESEDRVTGTLKPWSPNAIWTPALVIEHLALPESRIVRDPNDQTAPGRLAAPASPVLRIEESMVVVMYTDGGCRGNGSETAEAAWAFVVMDGDKVFWTEKERMGVATNNDAEYTALIRALGWASRLPVIKNIEVRCDSKLVVEQTNGRWSVNEPRLQAFVRHAQELLTKFDNWRIVWIPREQNREADALVNAALDGK
jgi:ribonuclease HI